MFKEKEERMMFNIDEIIKLKNEGFTAEDIVELSKIKAVEKTETALVEETKPVEVQKETAPVEETKPVEVPKEKELNENPIKELNSFNDKIDELINQIKINNIKNQYIEEPQEMSGVDILANVINPQTKEVLK